MPLQRTDTGETATPLQELQERNVVRKEQTDTALLKEALATSNVNCSNLIEQQNTLVKEQTSVVKEIRSDIATLDYMVQTMLGKAVKEIQAATLQAAQIKAEIKQTVKSEIMTTANEMKEYEKAKIDESLSEVKNALSATAKEIEKQREEYKSQGIFRKILFWAMPVLLLAQTILLIILMR